MSSRSVEAASPRRHQLRSPEVDRTIMSQEHKDKLRSHKAEITENMYPEDVLIRLQSRSVLTSKDVARVKDSGNIDSQNVHLLDLLLRKPGRAFHEFVDALRKTEQDHIAELLDPEPDPRTNATASSSSARIGGKGVTSGASNVHSDDEYLSSSSSPQRKRKAKSLGVRLNVSEEEADDEEDEILTPRRKRANRRQSANPAQDRPQALSEKLNEELLEAYILETRNLKEILRSPVNQQTILQRNAIMKTLSFLNEQRRQVQGIYEGSVIFDISCPDIGSLDSLWTSYISGELYSLFLEAANCEELGLRRKYNLKRILINVSICESEYIACRQEIINDDKENTNAHDRTRKLDSDELLLKLQLEKEARSNPISCRTKPIPLREKTTFSSSCQTPSPYSRPSSGVFSASFSDSDPETRNTSLWDEDLSVASLDISADEAYSSKRF